jgi:hypothetical protein
MEMWIMGRNRRDKVNGTLYFEQSSCILYTIHLFVRDWVTYRAIACAIICHVT